MLTLQVMAGSMSWIDLKHLLLKVILTMGRARSATMPAPVKLVEQNTKQCFCKLAFQRVFTVFLIAPHEDTPERQPQMVRMVE